MLPKRSPCLGRDDRSNRSRRALWALICDGLGASPHGGMTSQELVACIDWVAHGFEIVHSIFPGWKFTAADTVAGFGLHGALLIGPRRSIAANRAYWLDALPHFTVELKRNGAVTDTGEARNVLDGPLYALGHLVTRAGKRSGAAAVVAGRVRDDGNPNSRQAGRAA